MAVQWHVAVSATVFLPAHWHVTAIGPVFARAANVQKSGAHHRGNARAAKVR
jgi:hypothetical protein